MFNLCDVVTYDGINEKLVKIILSYEKGIMTKESKEFLSNYKKENNVKILYVDPIYQVKLDNIFFFKDSSNEDARKTYFLFEKLFNHV